MQKSIRLLGVAALALVVQATTWAGTPDYEADLVRTLKKYGSIRSVPLSSRTWLAKTFDRSSAQVALDLARLEGATATTVRRTTTSSVPTRPSTTKTEPVKAPVEESVEIPSESWEDEPELDPTYARDLENVIEKYGSVAAVPASSIRWLADRWSKTSARVSTDLRRVKSRSPEVVSDNMYSY